MESDLLNRVLYAQLLKGFEVTITVTGVSMEPSLYAGDTVTVKKAESYNTGDILVFLYKNDELLIHRLLKVKNGRYYCKGDNALRLEDIPYEHIAGKAVLKNGGEILPPTETLINLSYLVNRCFRKSGYNAEKTKNSGIYRFYKSCITKKEDLTITYKTNNNMDYISADDTSMAVFDPESGDTHFFDEVAIDILNCLKEPCTMEVLLDKLCEIYDATPNDIKKNVDEFLAECISKKVVIAE